MSETGPEPPAVTVGGALRACRLDRGLTQEELAESAGLSVRAIRDLERARAVPRRRTVELLARALKLDQDTWKHLDGAVRASRVSRRTQNPDAAGLPPQPPVAHYSPAERAPAAYRPAQLPHDVVDFVGRQVELGRLRALADEAAAGSTPGTRICVLDGPGGVGKTALAVHLGHAVADRFPDGQLYIDLCGFHPDQPPVSSTAALGAFLRAAGVDAARVPVDPDERAAMFRSVLAGKRVLIVLDNAASARQVRALLPGRASCLALVTSRSRLADLVARDGAVRITLEAFSHRVAVELLTSVIGPDRVCEDPEAADRLARSSGYLPLALRMTAEHVLAHDRLPLRALAAELSREHRRTDPLSDDDDAPVRWVITWSRQSLDSGAARLFRVLGADPGLDITPPAAAALADRPQGRVRQLLDELTSRNLLADDGGGRYRLHDLTRVYTTDHAGPGVAQSAAERELAARRLTRWYLAAAVAADRMIAPRRHRGPLDAVTSEHELPQFESHQDATAWCDRESANLVGATRHAAAAGDHATAWQIPWALLSYFDLRKAWDEWLWTHEIGLASARASGDRFGEAAILTGLGHAHYYPRRFADATDCYRRAGRLWREIGDRRGEAAILNAVGNVHLEQRDLDQALDHYRDALRIDRAIGDRHGEGVVLNNLAETHCELGAFDRALDYASAALAASRETGYRRIEAFSLCHLARALAATGSLGEALARFDDAIAVSSRAGDRQVEAWAFDYLGRALASAGRGTEARRHWDRAVDLFAQLGDPQAIDVRERLAALPATHQATGLDDNPDVA